MSTKNKKVWIVLFIVPCMILFVLIYAAPIVTVLYTSLCEYTVSTSPVLKGLENFKTIFQDKDFLEIIYVFLTIFLYLLKCPQSLIL